MTESRTETMDEDTLELFDDSYEDSETFDGFTIRDVRAFLSVDRQTPLYTSSPSLPQATKARRNPSTASDQEVEGEYSHNVSKVQDLTNKNVSHTLSEPTRSDAVDSPEDSEIEGEMEEKVFSTRKPANKEKNISEPEIFFSIVRLRD